MASLQKQVKLLKQEMSVKDQRIESLVDEKKQLESAKRQLMDAGIPRQKPAKSSRQSQSNQKSNSKQGSKTRDTSTKRTQKVPKTTRSNKGSTMTQSTQDPHHFILSQRNNPVDEPYILEADMTLKPPKPLMATLASVASDEETSSYNLNPQTRQSRESITSNENQKSVRIDLSTHMHNKKSSMQTGSLQLSTSTTKDMQMYSQKHMEE